MRGKTSWGNPVNTKKRAGYFSARFLDWSLVVWQLVDTQAAGAVCQALLNKLSAWSRCCTSLLLQESALRKHIRGFILWIPFMSQGYKDFPPWGKPKGLAWNKNWPGSKDVTQAVRRSRGSSSGLCAVEMVEGEILQLKAILRSLRGKSMTC